MPDLTRRGWFGAIAACVVAPKPSVEDVFNAANALMDKWRAERLMLLKTQFQYNAHLMAVGDVFTIAGITGQDGGLKQFRVVGVGALGTCAVVRGDAADA